MRQVLVALVVSLTAATSHAALLGRLPMTPGDDDYQAYYDTVLNVTWLTDANLATTNTFGLPRPSIGTGGVYPDGSMNWDIVRTWIAAMNAANYLGVNNWRLPNMDVNGDHTVTYCAVSSVTSCRDNEMGYMFYQNHVTWVVQSPFVNLSSASYWSGTDYAADPSYAWAFTFAGGGQNPTGNKLYYYSDLAWPVSPGDIGAVPTPAAAWLLGSALGVLSWARCRALRG